MKRVFVAIGFTIFYFDCDLWGKWFYGNSFRPGA